jgi:hypothetical protein
MIREMCMGLLAACILSGQSLDAEVISGNFIILPSCSAALIAACETLLPEAYREKLGFSGAAFFFHPEADGGGDGGGDGGSGAGTGGDGSGGASDSGGDGSGGASDSGDAASGASDSSGSASDSPGTGDNGDPDPDPGTTDNGIAAAVDENAPTDITNVDPFAQQAYDAVANPFGGVPDTVPLQNTIANSAGAEPVPGSPGVSRNPGNPGTPGREPNSAPPPPTAETPAKTRAEIHAVIVSGLADPSQVLRGNVHLTGGIVALGSPDSSAPQPLGRWDPNVKITPDPELLNGNKIPPLVPNVIDVRIMHHEVSATMESAGSISGQPEPALNNAGRDGP